MNRRQLFYTGLVMWGVLGLTMGLLNPWQPLGAGSGGVRPDLSAAFSAGEIARAASFRSALGAWPYLGIVLGTAVPWGVWVSWATFSGSPRSRASSRVVHGVRRFALILAVVVVVAVLQWVVAAPASVHSELVLRRFGLSTQGWSEWLRL